MATCTCVRSQLIPSTSEKRCAVHGEAAGQGGPVIPQDPTSGTPDLDPQGVPLVDLTATVKGIYAHAENARQTAYQLRRAADAADREVTFLEHLAGVLSGELPARPAAGE